MPRSADQAVLAIAATTATSPGALVAVAAAPFNRRTR